MSEKVSPFAFAENQREKFRFLYEEFKRMYELNAPITEGLLRNLTNYLLEIYLIREEVITRCINLAKKGDLED